MDNAQAEITSMRQDVDIVAVMNPDAQDSWTKKLESLEVIKAQGMHALAEYNQILWPVVRQFGWDMYDELITHHPVNNDTKISEFKHYKNIVMQSGQFTVTTPYSLNVWDQPISEHPLFVPSREEFTVVVRKWYLQGRYFLIGHDELNNVLYLEAIAK
jgi:hypothetical protein